MSDHSDPILKIEAQTKLDNLALRADLDHLEATTRELFTIKVPELKTITTEEELRNLIEAVRAGTADNERLTKFIRIAGEILERV